MMLLLYYLIFVVIFSFVAAGLITVIIKYTKMKNKNNLIIVHKCTWEDAGYDSYVIVDSQGRGSCRLNVITNGIYFDDYKVWLSDLQVSKEHQRAGVGTSLINKAKEFIPVGEQAAVDVIQNAPDWHIDFYEKHGFVIANKDTYNTHGDEYLD